MNIYILRAYPNEHKWVPASWVIGYFTNKATLQKAILENRDVLGIYDKQAFQREFYKDFYLNDPFSSPDSYMECGSIERVTANEYEF